MSMLRELAPQIWYFFSYSSNVFLFPYVPLIFSKVGMDAGQIGVLSAARTWLGAVGMPVGAILADKWRCHHQLRLASYLVSVALLSALWYWVAGPGALSPSRLLCVAAITLAAEFIKAPATVLGDAAIIANSRSDSDFGRKRVWATIAWGALSPAAGYTYGQAGFAGNFIGYAAFALPAAIAVCFLGHPASTHSKHQDDSPGLSAPPHGSGEQGPLTEALLDAADAHMEPGLPEPQFTVPPPHNAAGPAQGDVLHSPPAAPHHLHSMLTCGTPAAEAIAAGSTLTSVVAAAAPAGAAVPLLIADQHEAPVQEKSYCEAVMTILGNARVWVLLLMCVTNGVGSGMIDTYIFIFMSGLGAPALLLGLMLTVSCIAETPVFLMLGGLIKLIGPQLLLHVSMGGLVLRLCCYALLPQLHNPWLVLPIELLHGVTYAVAWGTCCVYAKRLAPPGTLATMQGLLDCATFGVGAGVGGAVGGQLLQRLGPRGLWWAAAAVVASGWGASVAAHLLLITLPGLRRGARGRGPQEGGV